MLTLKKPENGFLVEMFDLVKPSYLNSSSDSFRISSSVSSSMLETFAVLHVNKILYDRTLADGSKP